MPGEYPISLEQDMRYFHFHDTQTMQTVLRSHAGFLDRRDSLLFDKIRH